MGDVTILFWLVWGGPSLSVDASRRNKFIIFLAFIQNYLTIRVYSTKLDVFWYQKYLFATYFGISTIKIADVIINYELYSCISRFIYAAKVPILPLSA